MVHFLQAASKGICLLALTACQQPAGKPQGDLAGEYLGWIFMDGKFDPMDGKNGVENRITLKADGTFTEVLHSRVMYLVDRVTAGRYTVVRNRVILDGKAHQKADDGYRKSDETVSVHEEYDLDNGMLRREDGKRDPFYFRKVGTGPPPTPERLRLKPSDAAAVALIKRVERTYSALKSYADAAKVKSHGGGFMARDARLFTRFKRPRQFCFRGAQLAKGKEWAYGSVWTAGGKTWLEDSESGKTERPLGNGLGILGVTYGDAATLIPSLMLPKEMNGSELSEQPEATLLKDEAINGHPCHVLQLRSRGASITKVWVDKATLMIRQIYDGIREGWTTIEPKPNVPLKDKDFRVR